MKKSQPIRVIAAHRLVFAAAAEPRQGMHERGIGREGGKEGGRESIDVEKLNSRTRRNKSKTKQI